MSENEKILKELRRREFKSLLQNKDYLSQIISDVLGIDKEYIKKNIKTKKQTEYDKNDLITKITETRIKIKTSKYNKTIKNLYNKGNFYIAWYDEKQEEFKIKIYIDKIFEYCYKGVQKEEEKNIKKLLNNKQVTKEELINLSILKISLIHCENMKINICSKI